jgi:lysophospholipase L1-like esterase
MHWTGTWTTSSAAVDGASFENRTLRMLMRTSIAGAAVRVRLSNAHGSTPVLIAASSIALRRGAGAAVEPSSVRALTFGGERAVTIAAGALVVSDPVDLDLPALADVAVTMYAPGAVTEISGHKGARQTNYVSPAGDFGGEAEMPVEEAIESWYFSTCIEVAAPASTLGFVAMGDSLTDANISTPNTNNRWTDQLARRIVAARGSRFAGVMNQGIGGNRIVYDVTGDSGQKRFDRDVLAQPGATHLVLLLGTNDLRNRRSVPHQEAQAPSMIAGLKQIGTRARAAGLTAFVGTLMPYENETFVPGCWNPAREAVRQAVNDWIRKGEVFDGVVDFDAALRDPANPTRLLPEWDCGDHLHPSDAGYRKMGDVVADFLTARGVL